MAGPHKKSLAKRMYLSRWTYIMLAPTLILLFLFAYLPIYGVIIAFQDYKIGNAMMSITPGAIKWVGVKHFKDFLNSIFFSRVFGNTLRLSVKGLAFGFWIPIVFALLLNEIRHSWYKRITQTFVYLPYFVSVVIVVALLTSMVESSGLIGKLYVAVTGKNTVLINSAQHFDTLYIGSGIWQTFGYSAIIYIAAISSIDPTLYEAAIVDGANRFQRVIHITLPGILPTIVILLILSVGGMLNSNTEKVILLKNASTATRAEVIGSYVYQVGLRDGKYSYTSAVGLFTNIINFFLIYCANTISRRVGGASLW